VSDTSQCGVSQVCGELGSWIT